MTMTECGTELLGRQLNGVNDVTNIFAAAFLTHLSSQP